MFGADAFPEHMRHAQVRQLKLCYECKFIYISNYHLNGSDLTPDDPFRLSCSKGFWELDTQKCTVKDLRHHLEMADTCTQFIRRDDKDDWRFTCY